MPCGYHGSGCLHGSVQARPHDRKNMNPMNESPTTQDTAEATPASTGAAMPPHAPPSRRGRWLGALVALLVMLALGGTAWYLIHRPAAKGPGGFGQR